MRDAKVLKYTDRHSTSLLWWKAALLIPIWGFLALPIFGVLVGNELITRITDIPAQFGFGFGLAYFISYFFEDVLKCRIRIEEDILFFGYRSFHLSELATVGLLYKENQILPNALVLNFKTGKKLKLRMSRLRADDLDWLVKYIETKHANTAIDPTLRTLSKCNKVVRTTALETEDAIEIPYASRRIYRQLYDTFMSTLEQWTRVGPLLTFFVLSPVWLMIYSGLFSLLTFSSLQAKKILLRAALENLLTQTGGSLGSQLRHIGPAFEPIAKFIGQLFTNPYFCLAAVCALFGLLYYLSRFLFRPNVIMMRPDAMALQFRAMNTTLDITRVSYKTLTNAYLKKPNNSADSDKWKIVFNRRDKLNPLELSLGSLTSENRFRFLQALQRFAPECTIDPELAETMMPRQERSYTELWLQSLSAPMERKNLEPLAPPQLLQDGKYEVLQRLGVGGQGFAYLCRTASETNIVLKETILPVFVENTVRQQALERFQQEAKLLDELAHDGIVGLIDYFIEDHRGYLVLEHIEGKTLRQRVQEEGPMSEEQVRELAVQMSQILAYLHERGIIHRDFTPDNLILRPDGKLKLIDFNVAQQTQDGTTGTIVGKHAYLPPEQFRGKATNQSDIYAMGCTLFYLLAGKDPEPITKSRPSESNVVVSAELDTFISDCTELQSKRRIQSVNEALKMLAIAPDNSESITISLKKEELDQIPR